MAAFDLSEIAEKVVESYGVLPGITVALIAGSVARGIADEASDLDLYLYWDQVDSDVLGEPNRLRPLGCELLFAVPTDTGIFEKHRLNGRMIDVESVAVAAIDDVIGQIDSGEVMSPVTEKTAAGLVDGMALIGHDVLASWQARLRYSDELARSQVKSHVRDPPCSTSSLWDVGMP